jgi:glycosyltransferase involved in cell wall biosynthesis
MSEPALRAPLAVVVLTYNEERNLAACLDSVAGLAQELFVVDSGSTDETIPIAQRYGATVVKHPYETHARQWLWVLANVPVASEWILALDADQRVTSELGAEIRAALAGNTTARPGPVGYYIKRRQIFRGRWIKHGGYYPKYLLRLFRHAVTSLNDGDLVDHHFRVDGDIAKLRHDLVEDNANEADISFWIAKHHRFAVLQAREEFTAAQNGRRTSGDGAPFGSPDDRVRWLKRVWARLPLYLRPCLYFAYRYVVRLGFLDGKEGFIFHVLQTFWYRLVVDIMLDELRDAALGKTDHPDVEHARRWARDGRRE